METLKIKVNKEVLSEILKLLSQFKPEDFQIISEETGEVKRLRERFDEINSKDAKFISLEELEANLERSISKYEN